MQDAVAIAQCPECARLEAEIEGLRFELEEVRGRADDLIPYIEAFGVCYTDARILRYLHQQPLAYKERLFLAIYGDRPEAEQPKSKIFDVLIFRLRQKLAPSDITIKTLWGTGWSISPAHKQRITELITQGRPDELVA